MKHKIRKYVQVLRIELEDLEADLELMTEIYSRKEAQDEITDYVFLENVSVLKTEISGIASIIRSIDDIPTEEFTDLPELVEYIDGMFRERTKRSDYPEGVYALVRRKLYKVLKYVENTEE